MYIYVVYFNKKMITSSNDINDIFNYIFSIYSKSELNKFNPEFFGNDYITKYTLDKNVIYIIREKTDFIRNNLKELLKKSQVKTKKLSIKNKILEKKEESENLSVFKPHKEAKDYSKGTIRTGLDNNLYQVVKNKDNSFSWVLFK